VSFVEIDRKWVESILFFFIVKSFNEQTVNTDEKLDDFDHAIAVTMLKISLGRTAKKHVLLCPYEKVRREVA
jgi:hypothetical protein